MFLLRNCSEILSVRIQLGTVATRRSYQKPKMASCNASSDVLRRLIQIFSRYNSQEDISIEVSNLKQHCERALVQSRESVYNSLKARSHERFFAAIFSF